ncbi:unnamed protein product [Lymnaea stagnalis]|uniref:Neurensin-1 n=1 Tax=Lymnaea stagnalis TaxID=6523 RepID=A0AAV2IIJ6_LYMST
MAGYGEGYTEPLDGSSSDGPAEEKHEVAGSKRGSKDTGSKQKRKRSCPMYFGVKSYLHHFYEDHTFKDPSVYEDDDHQFLLQPHQRRRRCTPIWWKLFMWIGVTLLLFGVIGILIGYLVPPRHVLIGDSTSGDAYVDEKAQEYNTTLDMCKLIGLILFCVGGVTLAMALLFPSFLTRYCDDEAPSDDPDMKVPLQPGAIIDEKGPLGPLQTIIPSSSKVKEVQPSKKPDQQMLTQTAAAMTTEK